MSDVHDETGLGSERAQEVDADVIDLAAVGEGLLREGSGTGPGGRGLGDAASRSGAGRAAESPVMGGSAARPRVPDAADEGKGTAGPPGGAGP